MNKFNTKMLIDENNYSYEKLLEINNLSKITKMKTSEIENNMNIKLLKLILVQNLENKLEFEKRNLQYDIKINNNIINMVKLHNK
jgi:hypothetical protein